MISKLRSFIVIGGLIVAILMPLAFACIKVEPLNGVLVIAIAVITIVSLSFPVVWDNELAVILEAVSWHIGQVASIMMIASYESVFDAYRINRENSVK